MISGAALVRIAAELPIFNDNLLLDVVFTAYVLGHIVWPCQTLLDIEFYACFEGLGEKPLHPRSVCVGLLVADFLACNVSIMYLLPA